MSLALPFDPASLPIENEVATRARHQSFEWREGTYGPVFGDDYALDPAFAADAPTGGRDNVFTDTYDEASVHVTLIEDGVLVGRQFLVCDRLEPTLSKPRLDFVPLQRITERLDVLEPQPVECGPTYLVGANNVYHNYYHWSVQSLPSIALLRKVARERGLDYRIVLPPLGAMQQRSLELLGVHSSECVTLEADRFLCGVPLLYTNALCSDFMFRPSAKLIELLDPYREACLGRASADLPSRFYLSRRDAPRRRRLENEAELALALEARGYRELVMSELSLEDQVSVFAGAESIVAPHGAGLANLMFAPPTARLIEIMPEGYRCAHFFRLSQVRGMGYSEVRADIVGAPADNPRVANLLRVDAAKVLAALDRSEARRVQRAA